MVAGKPTVAPFWRGRSLFEGAQLLCVFLEVEIPSGPLCDLNSVLSKLLGKTHHELHTFWAQWQRSTWRLRSSFGQCSSCGLLVSLWCFPCFRTPAVTRVFGAGAGRSQECAALEVEDALSPSCLEAHSTGFWMLAKWGRGSIIGGFGCFARKLGWAIPLPGVFFSSTRETHLFPRTGHL